MPDWPQAWGTAEGGGRQLEAAEAAQLPRFSRMVGRDCARSPRRGHDVDYPDDLLVVGGLSPSAVVNNVREQHT